MLDTECRPYPRGGSDLPMFAPDDAAWLADRPRIPCRVRPYRAEDSKRIRIGSDGSVSEKAWVTLIFRNGTHVADFFANPRSRRRGALIDRVAVAVEGYLDQNPEWAIDPQ